MLPHLVTLLLLSLSLSISTIGCFLYFLFLILFCPIDSDRFLSPLIIIIVAIDSLISYHLTIYFHLENHNIDITIIKNCFAQFHIGVVYLSLQVMLVGYCYKKRKKRKTHIIWVFKVKTSQGEKKMYLCYNYKTSFSSLLFALI